MAEALFTDLLGKITSFLQQEVVKEVRLLVGVEDEIKKLSTTLETIKAVLEDAEKKQVTDKSVELWLENLKDVAYEMEDLLEEWIIKSADTTTTSQEEEEEAQPDRPMKDKLLCSISSPCYCFKPVVVRHDVGHKIKAIRKQLEFLVKEKNKFKLVKSSALKEPDRKAFLTTSLVDVSNIYGRNHDKDFIVSKLLLMSPSDGSSSAQVQVEEGNYNKKGIPIIAVIGTGGMGKTTLAQFVYNDPQVQSHFEKTLWVCVSDPFDKIRLAKEITGGAAHHTASDHWNDQLHCSLRDAVKDKRFLLVLDDVWTEEYADWEPLKLALNHGAQGSWILVTTRSNLTALAMRASLTHNIEELPEPDCWSLFSSIAFADREIEDHEKAKFEHVGRKIVKKCKGVPLSVKAMAGVMFFKKTIEDWEGVLESDTWQERLIEHKVLPSLLFSYYASSPNLKRCFTYCAVFPKDTVLQKDELVKSWMAHGYLNTEGGAQNEFEKIGEEYFDNLAMRSFFQNIETDEYGRIYCAKMHDLVHDLAQFLSKNESGFHELGKIVSFDPKKIRHLTVSCRLKDVDSLSTICNMKKLRSLKFSLDSEIIFWTFKRMSGSIVKSFGILTCLRELDISWSKFERIPNEIEKLIHLRYLDLTASSKLIELPETLRNLRNLQTLRLNRCSNLCKLPEGIKEMISLRHLEIDDTDRLSFLPQGLGQLSNLHTLTKFIVSGDTISTCCQLNDLKDLNLHGKLEIRGLGKVKNVNEATKANLNGKKHLSSVILDFGYDDGLESLAEYDMERQNGVLEGLQVHENVKEIAIRSYHGSRFPSWMLRDSLMLFNLKKLSLEKCKKCTRLPPFWRLPYLEYIHVSGMDEVKCIDREFFRIDQSNVEICFPMLKKLEVAHMASLEVWDFIEENVNFMPQLCELIITECPMLAMLHALGKLRSLERLKLRKLDSIKCIGVKTLGISNRGRMASRQVAFPKLNSLRLEYLEEWEEWDFPVGQNVDQIMPCLQELSIENCTKLRTLSALGKLKMLEKLKIRGLNSVNYIGLEFLGVSNAPNKDDGVDNGEPDPLIAFPKLNTLEFWEMDEWELWEFPVGKNVEIMPCLRLLSITECMKLKALPALGRLKSLENLVIRVANSVKCIGLEFLGVVEDNNPVGVGTQKPNKILEAFPKLIRLTFEFLDGFEEWVLPEAEDMVVIMQCLLHMTIAGLSKLRALPALGTLKSLRSLEICHMDCIKRVGLEFLGISDADYYTIRRGDDREPLPIIVFPKLEQLVFYYMENLEKWEISSMPTKKDEEHVGAGVDGEDISITFPCLNLLSISNCPELMVIPHNISSCKPWMLEIRNCPELTQTSIPIRGMVNLQKLKVDGETLCLT